MRLFRRYAHLALVSILTTGLIVASAPALAATQAEIRQAQRLLTALGYEPGPIDGVAGRQVRAAVSAFQSEAGLPETGAVDAGLLSALRAAAAPPKPLPKPPAAVVAPAPPKPKPAPPSLTGQTWRFMDDDGASMTLTFRADGKVAGPAYAAGFAWRQDGDDLWLTYESPLGGQATRQGRLSGPDAMTGDGQSADGPGAAAAARAWSWRAERTR